MSTGLHSKIEIHIGGQLIETKEYDDTVENLIIGSGSDANICIDVEGIEQMHAVVTIGDGIPLLQGLSDNIQVNGTTHDPSTPLKDGDEVQIGPATLKWHITDLRAEEETDPGAGAAEAPRAGRQGAASRTKRSLARDVLCGHRAGLARATRRGARVAARREAVCRARRVVHPCGLGGAGWGGAPRRCWRGVAAGGKRAGCPGARARIFLGPE